MFNKEAKPEFFNNLSKGHFPGELGIVVTEVEDGRMCGEMEVRKEIMAPNGYIHAGSLVTFADSLAGYATVAHLPEGGKLFTTLELKSNFIKTVKNGTLLCECVAEHLGKSTHVWRAVITEKETGKKLALFSCTQLILY